MYIGPLLVMYSSEVGPWSCSLIFEDGSGDLASLLYKHHFVQDSARVT
jgi:hypothetical protein